MGNCSASTSDVDMTEQVKRGTLDKTCFEEHRALGQGGFGTVFAVTKKFGPANEREEFHAMKRLDKKRIIACPGMDILVMGELHFMEEISDDHSKKSEFLMKLECAFQDKAHVYLVQSLMEGGDALHLQTNSPKRVLTIPVIRWLTCNCLLGLESLHGEHSILHRDVKEENLLIDKFGYARLADFGMADKLKDGVSHAHGGTLPYMSPESRDKSRDNKAQRVTHDFFALGVMMYRMVCNHYPFDMTQHNFNTVVALHLNERALDKKDIKTTLVRADELNYEREMLPDHYKLNKPFLMSKCGGDEVFLDIVSKLTIMREDCRLGSKGGAGEVMRHKFFDGVDWEAIKSKTAVSPCVPAPNDMANICRGDLDVFEQIAFDSPGGKEEEDGISESQDKVFEEFYYNPWHVEEEAGSERRGSSLLPMSSGRSSSNITSARRKSGRSTALSALRSKRIQEARSR
eukprot:CAMPEP_0118658852 /NCGR_PEP_ID=MMETSP0785-20121206/14790_1 /TAXON_ID=91992 /ORGANISM="Bolidomonas pacifica, Strain CCMP 1866" /LENGTH=458 /DNA_ID=CAMNT_0006551899 /DNA_START=200 /DNA_END=1573 /DNA_ORIENTATION=+